jgi:hypothetical protein
MYYKSTLVQVVQKVVVHKQFFRQSHCFTYRDSLPKMDGPKTKIFWIKDVEMSKSVFVVQGVFICPSAQEEHKSPRALLNKDTMQRYTCRWTCQQLCNLFMFLAGTCIGFGFLPPPRPPTPCQYISGVSGPHIFHFIMEYEMLYSKIEGRWWLFENGACQWSMNFHFGPPMNIKKLCLVRFSRFNFQEPFDMTSAQTEIWFQSSLFFNGLY